MTPPHADSDPRVARADGRERAGLALVIAAIFVVSWPSTIPQILASWHGANAVPEYLRWLQILMVAPGLVAVWAEWFNGGWVGCRGLLRRLIAWRASWTVYAAVLLGPLLVVFAALFVSDAVGYTTIKLPSIGDVAETFIPTFLVYLVVNTEELAWRGYVLPRLQARMSPLVASVVLGVVWTSFHAPYFMMKGGHPGGFTPLLFALSLIPMTVLLTRTFNAAAGSVLLAHLLHQSINGWAEAVPFLPRFAGSVAPVAIGIAIMLALALVAVVLRPPMWERIERRPDRVLPPCA